MYYVLSRLERQGAQPRTMGICGAIETYGLPDTQTLTYLTVPNVSSPARSATSAMSMSTWNSFSRLARYPTVMAASVTSKSFRPVVIPPPTQANGRGIESIYSGEARGWGWGGNSKHL